MCYLLQDIYDMSPRTSCDPPCCNSFCYWGLTVLVFTSSTVWASATSLRLGWHPHPGNGTAGKSHHITTSSETCANCLKLMLGLAESMGEASRCAAHMAPASQVLVATNTGRCASHKAPARQVLVATKTGQTAERKTGH